jgi:hypothetical protein
MQRRHADAHRANQARFHQQQLKADHDRLVANLERKLLTTGVGALDRFEALFGRLWGDGKSDDELTENERAWRRLFLECREKIFDGTNHQIRNMRAELALHEVEKVGQQIQVKFNSSNGSGEHNG